MFRRGIIVASHPITSSWRQKFLSKRLSIYPIYAG
jgi:hypothetical protein